MTWFRVRVALRKPPGPSAAAPGRPFNLYPLPFIISFCSSAPSVFSRFHASSAVPPHSNSNCARCWLTEAHFRVACGNLSCPCPVRDI